MEGYEERINGICRVKRDFLQDSAVSGIPLEESLREITGILEQKKINVEEYLLHLWDEPDFQLRVLEEYCSGTISGQPLIRTFFALHYSKILERNINLLSVSLKKTDSIYPPVKKFILDIRNSFDLLLKGIFTRIAHSCFGNKRINDLAVLKIRNFHSYNYLNAFLVTNISSGITKLNKQFLCFTDFMKDNIIPIHIPAPFFFHKNSGVLRLSDLFDIINSSSDFTVIDTLLSSRNMLGSIHLYNEARGIIIEKFFDIDKHRETRNRYLQSGFGKILEDIEKHRNTANLNLEHLLQTVSLFSTLEQILYQIHRNSFYGIFEKLKVIYQKKNLNVENIFIMENSVLIINLLFFLNSCFNSSDNHDLTDDLIEDLSLLFCRISSLDKNFIKMNYKSHLSNLLSSMEAETVFLRDNMINKLDS